MAAKAFVKRRSSVQARLAAPKESQSPENPGPAPGATSAATVCEKQNRCTKQVHGEASVSPGVERTRSGSRAAEAEVYPTFASGDRVVITAGLAKGLEGTVLGLSRHTFGDIPCYVLETEGWLVPRRDIRADFLREVS